MSGGMVISTGLATRWVSANIANSCPIVNNNDLIEIYRSKYRYKYRACATGALCAELSERKLALVLERQPHASA